MNTGATTSEQSTVWSRFWSWLSPAKTAVAPSSEAPSVPEVAVSEAPSAPSEEKPAPSTPPSTPLQTGKSVEIPLDTKPLDVEIENSTLQPASEQPDKNDKHEEQPSQSASSAKSHQKKKKRH